MSMWLSVILVAIEDFPHLQTDSEALQKALSDATVGMQTSVLEDMAEDTGEEFELNFDESGVLDYDAGYGPAFYIEPADIKVLKNDFWSIAGMIESDIKKLRKIARKGGFYVVGILT